MSCFSCTSTNPEAHLLHFAGKEGGKSPIGWREGWNASSAQKHPIGNTIAAAINGPLNACALTTLGVMATPLVNNAVRDSIFGDSVCGPCISSAKTLTNLMIEIRKRVEGMPSLVGIDRTVFNTAQAGVSWMSGLTEGAKCVSGEVGQVYKCRAFNYAAGVVDVVKENIVPLAASVAVVGLVLACLSKSSFDQAEIDTENKLVAKLKDRYQQAADTLADKAFKAEGDKQKEAAVKELSLQILNRRQEIQSEIQKLKLPNMTWGKVTEITEPVFSTAIQIKNRKG